MTHECKSFFLLREQINSTSTTPTTSRWAILRSLKTRALLVMLHWRSNSPVWLYITAGSVDSIGRCRFLIRHLLLWHHGHLINIRSQLRNAPNLNGLIQAPTVHHPTLISIFWLLAIFLHRQALDGPGVPSQHWKTHVNTSLSALVRAFDEEVKISKVGAKQLMVDEGCKFSNDSCKFRSIPRKITVLLGLLVQHTSLHAETSVPAESLS